MVTIKYIWLLCSLNLQINQLTFGPFLLLEIEGLPVKIALSSHANAWQPKKHEVLN